MNKFGKRIYSGFGQFSADVGFLLKNLSKLSTVIKEGTIPPAFRERLILIVSVANGCRYCMNFHTRLALREVIPEKEIEMLLRSDPGGAPPNEVPALLYARRWAESLASPPPESREALANTYGRNVADAIELVLRAALLGNLMGNTWDYFLYRISLGRWGLHT